MQKLPNKKSEDDLLRHHNVNKDSANDNNSDNLINFYVGHTGRMQEA